MRRSEKLRQVGLGKQLRKLREKAGLSTRSVAAKLGISPSSVNRNELGLRAPSREEVSALCVLYGVRGEEKQKLIDRASEVIETAAWLESGHISDDLASLIVLEQESMTITNVAMSLIPGLAQTADYARLLLGRPESQDELVERSVVTRLGRQAVLSRPGAPDVLMFIHEGALNRTLGNERVLREQLQHLITLQRRKNVSVRVIPFDAPTRPATGTPFARYELFDGSLYILVETEGIGLFITEAANVQPFVESCRIIQRCALDEEGSVALIRKIAEGLNDG